VSRAIWQPLIEAVAGKSCETAVRLFLRSFEPFGTASHGSAGDRRGGP
jgi:hypothetical protein